MKRRRDSSRGEKGESINGYSRNSHPRIDTSSSTLSLRQQLALVKRAAAQVDLGESTTNGTAKPRVRTKFRKKKSGFDGVAEGDDRRIHDTAMRRKRSRPGEDILPEGKFTVNAKDPVVFIDAYNLVGAWPKLRKFRNRGKMDHARDALSQEVLEFACVRGWDCVIVYDAHGTAEACRTETIGENVDVVFTGSETADAYIERRVFELCEQNQRQVWVVTNDVAERNFAQAKGAHIMSASLFVQELTRVQRETADLTLALEDGATRASRTLIQAVDPETRNKLYRLRDGLDSGEITYR